ncbi:hypothetical protein F511_21572 [Dorcoceras hygrometricum]|uniref:Uncharacterized protein n=1 Tax=Dorcoceras hygrometricum TaxID=472368 RepID=A0A2Z7AH01_9LAMI|nr:hypothetical protein F511_21572 [Dorcoceras hygrometricum]
MTKELDDGEFWLPSGFLTDDELLNDFRAHRFTKKPADDFSHGFWCSSGFSSDLSSPVESSMGSTETESDEDDFIAFLTRKIAYASLKDSNILSECREQGLKLSGSPQSTLSGYYPGSSRGSPKCTSQVASPTEVKDPAGWDLLYAAAGEVARMKAFQEAKAFYSTKPNPFTTPQTNPSIMSGIYSNHKTQVQLSQQHMQAANFQKMTRSGIWGQQQAGSQFQNGRSIGERRNGVSTGAWPTLQQSHSHKQPPLIPRSGMRATYPGENGAKKERTGTGVFLPRRYETTPPESRKKPADRVVHLNLNLESIDIPAEAHFRGISNIKPQYDATLKPVSRIRMTPQQREFGLQPVMNQELWLPQEWTY